MTNAITLGAVHTHTHTHTQITVNNKIKKPKHIRLFSNMFFSISKKRIAK